ncbi:MAG: nucleotidyl transferase AbiEii/AbiGii toxin family protein [Anaerolineae bacterium]|nr:nucleotidyl transferase AbiEii/AbiGii toxin family protein [Anaerolineae bacterium]
MDQLGEIMTTSGFYLGGGTALALLLDHRHSVDLDWFHPKDFDPRQITERIQDAGIGLTILRTEEGTLHGLLSGVRVSLLRYRYPLLRPLVMWSQYRCHLAALEDLVCMKLVAITQRGAKKDFIDIYALGQGTLTLAEMLRLYQRKFDTQDIAQVLYALGYFADADPEDMPRLYLNTDWRTIKRTLESWVREIR